MDDITTLLARAEALAHADRDAAGALFAEILRRDPACLAAHNALEALGAYQRYGRWMHVNCVIDPRDDIFKFFAAHALASNPVREYLADGWRTLSELMVLLERLDRPLLKMEGVLEFAAGFGRFTRHLARALPGRVTCTDVQPGSVEFLREQFGVEAYYSSFAAEELRYPEKYDLVFVLSMFTHLPPARWDAWIASLMRAVKPGGFLVFTVHNEAIGREEGVRFEADGTRFLASSESPQLGADAYGTTYTTEEFVLATALRVTGNAPRAYVRQAFWVGQDAVVLEA